MNQKDKRECHFYCKSSHPSSHSPLRCIDANEGCKLVCFGSDWLIQVTSQLWSIFAAWVRTQRELIGEGTTGTEWALESGWEYGFPRAHNTCVVSCQYLTNFLLCLLAWQNPSCFLAHLYLGGGRTHLFLSYFHKKYHGTMHFKTNKITALKQWVVKVSLFHKLIDVIKFFLYVAARMISDWPTTKDYLPS